MRTKLITHIIGSHGNLDERINEWLEHNSYRVIDIKFTSNKYKLFALIIYDTTPTL